MYKMNQEVIVSGRGNNIKSTWTCPNLNHTIEFKKYISKQLGTQVSIVNDFPNQIVINGEHDTESILYFYNLWLRTHNT